MTMDATIATTPPGDIPTSVEENSSTTLILLTASNVTLFHTGGSNVRATVNDPALGAERSFLRVQIARAFPLSKPDQYIGLRDGNDKDIGMLPTLDGMDKASRAVINEELERRYFVPRITRILSLKDEFGNYSFEVETNRGPRSFIVQHFRDSVYELTPGRVMVTDKDGSRYEIPEVSRLEPKHYSIFQRVL